MKNIDQKIAELQALKEAKTNTYKTIADFIENFEVPKQMQTEYNAFKKLVINAINRRVQLNANSEVIE